MMYEIILKIKYFSSGSFEQKYRVVDDQYKETLKKYNLIGSQYYDHVVLVNELDDNKEFVRCII